MRSFVIIVALLALLTASLSALPSRTHKGREWTVTVKVPACMNDQNMQVIWPAKPNGTITVECDNLQ